MEHSQTEFFLRYSSESNLKIYFILINIAFSQTLRTYYLQRFCKEERMDPRISTRVWSDYEFGFGSPSSEVWLGKCTKLDGIQIKMSIIASISISICFLRNLATNIQRLIFRATNILYKD